MTFDVVPNHPSLAQGPARLKLENYPVQFDLPLRWSDVVDGRRIGSVGIARYFEDARMKFIEVLVRKSGIDRSDWESVIRQYSVEALADIQYPGVITVGCGIAHVGNTSHRGGYGMFQHGACVALSDAVIVWIGADQRPLAPVESVKRTLYTEMLRS